MRSIDMVVVYEPGEAEATPGSRRDPPRVDGELAHRSTLFA